MPLYQKFISLDEYYKNTIGEKIILNDVRADSDSSRRELIDNIYTTYTDDSIDITPSCDCGDLKGAYLLGKLCSNCSTTVKEQFDKTDPLLWLKQLDEDLPFMSPFFWLMLRNAIHKNFDTLRWLTDTSYNPPTTPDFISDLPKTIPEFERSYKYMINNLETILIHIVNSPRHKSANKMNKLRLFMELYKRDGPLLFSTYMPIINKKLFVMENTSKGKYTNLGVAKVIDLVMQFIKVVNDDKPTDRKLSNAMGVIQEKLANIYDSYYREYAAKKQGAFRKHVFGARSHFTFRAVITSISGPHMYDEIHVPWSIGVTVYRPHLLNLLKKRGINYKQANILVFDAVKKYIPIIDECLQELIATSRDGWLYANLHRN